jgi:hypothetical protein
MLKFRYFLGALLTMAYVADAGRAHAYIDPGTGSILLQGIVGGAATFLVVIRLYGAKAKRKILSLIGREPAERESDTPTADPKTAAE